MQVFLSRCAEIEDTIAAIYRELASKVCVDQALKAIWLAMADDEDEHGREIRLAKRMVKDDMLVGAEMSDPEVRLLLSKAQNYLGKVRCGNLKVKEALRLSLHLEEAFRRIHILCAVRFADSGMRRVFERLGKADGEHVARLTDYCQTFAAAQRSGAGAVPGI